MKRVALTLALALVGAGCSPRGTTNGARRLTGAGSTFVYPLMSRWVAAYHRLHPTVEINYQSIGSGGGIQQVRNGTVEFGASDAPLSDAQLRTLPPVIQIPESGGPVCITYNLPGLTAPLRLTGAALADIYLGRIANWRDPALLRANPGAPLPDRAILVVHRSEGSGTTDIFTEYLRAISPEWARRIGAGLAVAWPVGLGGKGSEGVTGMVRQTVGAIGYVELSFARENRLPVALVRNAAGEWVAPSRSSATAAIAAATAELARDPRTPIVNPQAPKAYPITGLTYLIVPRESADRARRAALLGFLRWILGPGQSYAAELEYAPLPAALVREDQRLLGTLR